MRQRGLSFLVYELVQNILDTASPHARITIWKEQGRPLGHIIAEDAHPGGFNDLSHAWTLFAPSEKKGDPEKRGRYNFGEKEVLAVCKSATLKTQGRSVEFHEDGTRTTSRTGTEVGTVFRATLRMNQKELDELLRAARSVISPIPYSVNGEPQPLRTPVREFEATLPTVIEGEGGELRRTKRKTTIRLYEPLEGETPSVYEMGIPIVEIGDRWHIDIGQKVPQNLDRDNITPAYRSLLRTLVLNHAHDLIGKAEATSDWVTEALGHRDVGEAAVQATLDHRFGSKRAIFDPSDHEANQRLVGQGYTVISGGAFSGDAWANIKRTKAAEPSGKIAPTHRPYSKDPSAPAVKVLDPSTYTDAQRQVVTLMERLAFALDVPVGFRIVRTTNNFAAAYCASFLGNPHIDLNLFRLGHKWFEGWEDHLDKVLDLLIHELAHHYSDSHLDDKYHEACTRLGASLTTLALRRPALFQ